MNRFPVLPALMSLLLIAVPVHALDGTAPSVTPPPPLASGPLEMAIQKLRVLGSVLFIAAHPDDENTALLTYLSRERGARVGYLSMTRGDGGQNLIGDEAGPVLGVIRTQELLAARRVDGAEQFFTRAIDFGYSKSTDESIEIWGGEEMLRDVVWVIRNFRPDVIVTRFTPDRGGHGHHTASALLAERAFEAAADPARFPDQLEHVKPWRARRVFWNVFSWRRVERDTTRPALTVDLGTYNPLIGRAYTEIAAESRTMHKSQGFGSAERRGEAPNLLELRAGEPAETDLFDGVDLGWSRLAGGARVDALLAEVAKRFDPGRPHLVLPTLMRVDEALDGLGDDPWVAVKRRELHEVIRSCAGLWIDAVAERPTAIPGDTLAVTATVVNRSEFPIVLESVVFPHRAPDDGAAGTPPGPGGNGLLENNRSWTAEARVVLPADAPYTHPYWLDEPPLEGRYRLDPARAGPAEAPPPLRVRVTLRASNRPIVFETPVVYRWTDPVDGERYRPLEIVPPVTLSFDAPVYVFGDTAARVVRVTARATRDPVSGGVHLALPRGWRSEPASVPVTLAGEGAEATAAFRVSPPAGGGEASLTADMGAGVVVGDVTYTRSLERIEYDHIPIQTLLPRAEARIVRADLRRDGAEIGYVMGPGDLIPMCLEQAGYRVALLSDDDLATGELARFDAIVTGVRAYDTRPRLAELRPRLLDYVNGGGTLVVQYSTTRGDFGEGPGPYPITLSRDRVTDEHAEVRFTAPEHPLLRLPNRITAADFEGWVQERGLYFANPWDPRYETVLSCNDPGEAPLEGGLLYARHGKGAFVFTSYAWFRQLPAGVPGAYRLFANLLGGGR